MINPIQVPLQPQQEKAQDAISSSVSISYSTNFEEGMESSSKTDSSKGEQDSHTKAVAALRKYLQRKLSSEDSSSEKECRSQSESPMEIEGEIFHQTVPVEDDDYRGKPAPNFSTTSSGRSKNLFLQKQRSLDDYSPPIPLAQQFFYNTNLTGAGNSSASLTISSGNGSGNHQRPEFLCETVLQSRCMFCDENFDVEATLRDHLRERHHWYYPPAVIIPQQEAVLDLSMRKSGASGSLPNLAMARSFSFSSLVDPSRGRSKGGIKCMTCGKGLSNKWNWKQHQKVHLRENLGTFIP